MKLNVISNYFYCSCFVKTKKISQKTIPREEQQEYIDDPDIPTTSNSIVSCVGPTNQGPLEKLNKVDSNLTKAALDLRSIDSDSRRLILTVRFILFTILMLVGQFKV